MNNISTSIAGLHNQLGEIDRQLADIDRQREDLARRRFALQRRIAVREAEDVANLCQPPSPFSPMSQVKMGTLHS